MLILAVFAGLGIFVLYTNPVLREIFVMWISKLSWSIAKFGGSTIKSSIKGVGIATSVSTAAILIVIPLIDANLSMSSYRANTIAKYWETLERAGKASDMDPFMIAAAWTVESGMSTTNPSNGQGIGGFYSSVTYDGKWFEPGPLTDKELEEQLTFLGNALNAERHCKGMFTYYSYLDDSTEQMWKRTECWHRYNGASYVKGDMTSIPAAFNNYPGCPDCKNGIICLVDGCAEVGPMKQDGYETNYLKIKTLIAMAATYEGGGTVQYVKTQPEQASFKVLFSQNMEFAADLVSRADIAFNKLSPRTTVAGPSSVVRTNSRTPFQYGIESYEDLPRPSLGLWGPSVAPLQGNWVVTNWDHGASYGMPGCVDMSTKGGPGQIHAPVSGYVTVYYDGLDNSVIFIENPEWIIIILHWDRLYVSDGDWVNADDVIAREGSVGNSTGQHVHMCDFNKTINSYVQTRRYVPGWAEHNPEGY
jgi:hypothetical protein